MRGVSCSRPFLPFRQLGLLSGHFMHGSIKMVENYIKTYGITAEKLQNYLQSLFPGHNIVVNVSDLNHTHSPPGSVQG